MAISSIIITCIILLYIYTIYIAHTSHTTLSIIEDELIKIQKDAQLSSRVNRIDEHSPVVKAYLSHEFHVRDSKLDPGYIQNIAITNNSLFINMSITFTQKITYGSNIMIQFEDTCKTWITHTTKKFTTRPCKCSLFNIYCRTCDVAKKVPKIVKTCKSSITQNLINEIAHNATQLLISRIRYIHQNVTPILTSRTYQKKLYNNHPLIDMITTQKKHAFASMSTDVINAIKNHAFVISATIYTMYNVMF